MERRDLLKAYCLGQVSLAQINFFVLCGSHGNALITRNNTIQQITPDRESLIT